MHREKLGEQPKFAQVLPKYHHDNTKYHHSIMKEKKLVTWEKKIHRFLPTRMNQMPADCISLSETVVMTAVDERASEPYNY